MSKVNYFKVQLLTIAYCQAVSFSEFSDIRKAPLPIFPALREAELFANGPLHGGEVGGRDQRERGQQNKNCEIHDS